MFTTARIKLTVWYLLIIMLISVMFSFTLYRTLTAELERGFHRISQRYTEEYGLIPQSATPDVLEPAYLQATEDRIIWTLVYINLIILGVSGVGGYILAGVTLKPIREMVDEQNRFVTDASHELRTPLTSLRSEIEVYLREKKPTLVEAHALITSNLEEVNNLQILSDRLIQLAQYQQSPKQQVFAAIALGEVLEHAIKKAQKPANQKHIALHASIEPCSIQGDNESLVQIFSILLDNAIKYSPKNTTVTIRAKKIDDSVAVTVTDEGIGIEEKDKKHIFDRFYRADTSRTKQDIPGYGLGLSIAKKIIHQHKGSIQVTSAIDKGTTFTVQLPIIG